MAWGDYELDEGAEYQRKLPQLGDDSGRVVTPQEVSKWMDDWQASVDEAVELVLEIGVDRVIAALESLDVLRQEKDWLDE